MQLDDGIGIAVDVVILSGVKVAGILSEDGISGIRYDETQKLVTFVKWV